MQAALLNLHGDNFGDFLNAAAAASFCEEKLGATVAAALARPAAWTWHADRSLLGCDVEDFAPRRAFRLDVRLHALGVAHPCPNARIWRALQVAASSTDFALLVPAGAGLGEYRDYASLAAMMQAARFSRSSGILFGTVGPSGSHAFDRAVASYASSMSVSVRGGASAGYLRSIGLTSSGPTELTLWEASRRLRAGLAPRRECVSLVLGDALRWHPAAKALGFEGSGSGPHQALLEAVLNDPAWHDREIELIPHSPLAQERGHLESVCAAVAGQGRVRVRQDVTDLDSYLGAVASSGTVVSLRYHGVVSALAAGVPVVAVAYEQKSKDLHQMAGASFPLVDISRGWAGGTADQLRAAFATVQSGRRSRWEWSRADEAELDAFAGRLLATARRRG